MNRDPGSLKMAAHLGGSEAFACDRIEVVFGKQGDCAKPGFGRGVHTVAKSSPRNCPRTKHPRISHPA
jgi:hypothetical protein